MVKKSGNLLYEKQNTNDGWKCRWSKYIAKKHVFLKIKHNLNLTGPQTLLISIQSVLIYINITFIIFTLNNFCLTN